MVWNYLDEVSGPWQLVYKKHIYTLSNKQDFWSWPDIQSKVFIRTLAKAYSAPEGKQFAIPYIENNFVDAYCFGYEKVAGKPNGLVDIVAGSQVYLLQQMTIPLTVGKNLVATFIQDGRNAFSDSKEFQIFTFQETMFKPRS